MNSNSNLHALKYLQTLVGQPINYAYKASDLDLYDFGFGSTIEKLNWQGEECQVCSFVLHATCRFEIIHRPNGVTKCVERFYEDTLSEDFRSSICRLFGLKVMRVALSDKNDLWLDFGEYWIVFATFENGEESWRFFALAKDMPHLVASNLWLDM